AVRVRNRLRVAQSRRLSDRRRVGGRRSDGVPPGLREPASPNLCGQTRVTREVSVNRTLSIVIPAFNEAENILGALEHVTAAVAGLPLDHEIVVVDDGSTDGTAALVSANTHRFPGTRLLVNDRNRGFGWTYRRGVEAATLDFI